MSEEKPETKDSFREDVEDRVSDDLSVNVNVAGTVGNAPDARMSQFCFISKHTVVNARYVHRIDRPQDQGESTNGSEEGSGLGILGLSNRTAVHGQLVDDHEVSNASYSIISPLGGIILRESGEKAGQDHDDVSDDGDEDVSTVQTSQKRKIQEQERGGESPIDVSCPIDLTVDGLGGIGEMLLGVFDSDLLQSRPIADRHCIVRDGSESGDEGRQDMEQSFLLPFGYPPRSR